MWSVCAAVVTMETLPKCESASSSQRPSPCKVTELTTASPCHLGAEFDSWPWGLSVQSWSSLRLLPSFKSMLRLTGHPEVPESVNVSVNVPFMWPCAQVQVYPDADSWDQLQQNRDP